MNNVITHRPARRPLSQACRALGLNRSSVYAHRKRADSDLEPQRSRQYAVQPEGVNPVESSNDGTMRCDRVNFPTLTAAGYVK